MSHEESASQESLWTIYVRLWGRAEGAGAYVKYEAHAPFGEAGWFHPHVDEPSRGPEIVVVRAHYEERSAPTKGRTDKTPVSLMLELCTLAHEVGHLRSWLKGNRTKEYESALLTMGGRLAAVPRRTPLLDSGDRLLIENEEKSAWQLGRRELRDLGFVDWNDFDTAERAGLAVYAEILG